MRSVVRVALRAAAADRRAHVLAAVQIRLEIDLGRGDQSRRSAHIMFNTL